MQFPASSVRDLARLLEIANLGEISLESRGDKLTIKRAAPQAASFPSPEFVAPADELEVENDEALEAPATPATSETKIIASSWVGVFRAAKTPLEVGANVKKGQHLGAVESLKVPFDITATSAGTLAQIFVENGQGVEWGQPLFEITPEA